MSSPAAHSHWSILPLLPELPPLCHNIPQLILQTSLNMTIPNTFPAHTPCNLSNHVLSKPSALSSTFHSCFPMFPLLHILQHQPTLFLHSHWLPRIVTLWWLSHTTPWYSLSVPFYPMDLKPTPLDWDQYLQSLQLMLFQGEPTLYLITIPKTCPPDHCITLHPLHFTNLHDMALPCTALVAS